jgi:hypothetical protein
MLDFGNAHYYFDLDALDKAVTLKTGSKDQVYSEKETKTTKSLPHDGTQHTVIEDFVRTIPQIKEIDSVKYDLIRYFIEVVVDTEDGGDDTLGIDRALDKMTFGYKLVFNTLFKHGIIKETEEE